MLSIVTITFNNFEELKSTIESLPANLDFEHIIINGGDCKKTMSYLKDHSPNYPCIKVSEADDGIYDAFNKGIRHSTGEYIQFLNSGDRLNSVSYLKQAIATLDEQLDKGFVHSNLIFEDQTAGDIRMGPTNRNIGRGLPYQHPTMIVRKSLFDEIGFFEVQYRYAADYDFVVKLLKLGIKGIFVKADAIKMDGKGVSINHEWGSITECFQSLRRNSYLNFNNSIGYIERVLFYIGRRILIAIKLKFILVKLKKVKHK
ncbi:MAG: glycosyltransferase [Bacteriovoracaceae bacterium]|nr:glycosyltransferase [Bacteriovoracaceae bacterium]